MGLYDHWPYTNFHELNLSWILRRMEELSETVKNFVALNTIKYADPIQWNITTQYEANTVVVDPQSGTAYISTKPVPAGVALSNDNYWSVIFTLDVISANKNITLRDDGTNVLATFGSAAGDWLLWNGTLYKVSQAINVNEAYVAGYNIDRYTVELFIRDYVADIMADIANIESHIGDLSTLTTTDKTNLVAAINEVLQTLNNVAGDLSTLTTTDKTNLVAAINEVLQTLNNVAGDLSTLTTTDKTSLVAAINEIDSYISNLGIYNVKDFGAVGDGTTDDTDAVMAATAAANRTGGIIYFPQGNYFINQPIVIRHHGTCVKGASPQSTYIHTQDESCILIDGRSDAKLSACSVKDISLYRMLDTNTTGKFGIRNNYNTNGTINNVIIEGFNFGVYNDHSGNNMLYTVGVVQRAYGATGFTFTNGSVSDILMNCYVANTGSNGGAVDTGTGVFCGGEHIGDLAIYYLDVANGGHGLWVDGSEMLSGYRGADFRFHNIVVDGNRQAAIYLNNIGGRGNVVIDGGWINPSIRAGSGGIEMHTVNNVAITNMIIQQLSDAAPSNLYGIWGGNATYLSISDIIFKNIYGPISLASIDRVNINNNQISVYDLASAISTYGINLTTATNVIINGNSVNGSYIRGISADGDSIICSDNIVKRATTPISITASSTKIVENNIPSTADIETYAIGTGLNAYKAGHIVTLCFANYSYSQTSWQPLLSKWLPVDVVNAPLIDGSGNTINRLGILANGNYRIITPNGSSYASGTYSGTVTYITNE